MIRGGIRRLNAKRWTGRSGQENPVFVYRMIAEGSVEATIVEMQARKKALANALFEGGGEGALALTEEDLNALLMPIG